MHISIFNMSMENNLKYYDFDEDIMFWINENWDLLQVDEVSESILAFLMEKYKLIQGLGQGQKYWSDPDVLTLLF